MDQSITPRPQADDAAQGLEETPGTDNTAQSSDTIEVDDLNKFVKLLTRWHGGAVKRAEHFLQVPEGQEIKIGEDAELVLTGDTLRAFKAGVNCALMQLGTLPFAYETEPAEDAPTPT
jgi:hypothetical protein